MGAPSPPPASQLTPAPSPSGRSEAQAGRPRPVTHHPFLPLPQDSKELSSFVRSEGPRSLELRLRPQQAPRSRALVVHIHGGGFVAQTSKSHEPYLKSWAQELGAPILSIDYSLAPEAPFPRALEECFYAYCWAVKHCALLGEPPPSLPQPPAQQGQRATRHWSLSLDTLPARPPPTTHLCHLLTPLCPLPPPAALPLLPRAPTFHSPTSSSCFPRL